MARARTIKPGFFINEDLSMCSPLARLLFIGLWTVADCDGRLEDRPKRIKAQLLPYDDCDVDALLNELRSGENPFIHRYTAKGVDVLQVVNWQRHQRIFANEPSFALPTPEGEIGTYTNELWHLDSMKTKSTFSTTKSIDVQVLSNKSLGARAQENGDDSAHTTQEPKPTEPTHFDIFWDAYPRVRRRDKVGAKKAYDAAVKRLAGVCADPHAFLLARATAYAASPLGSGQYSKMPASWLNAGAYDDDGAAWQALDRPLTTAEHNRNFFDDLKQEIINGHDAGNDSRQTELPIHRIQRQGDA